jgi:hypothetical protein
LRFLLRLLELVLERLDPLMQIGERLLIHIDQLSHRVRRVWLLRRKIADEPLGLRVARTIFGGLQPFEDAGDDLALFGGHGLASIASRHVRLDSVAKPSANAHPGIAGECAETPLARAWPESIMPSRVKASCLQPEKGPDRSLAPF